VWNVNSRRLSRDKYSVVAVYIDDTDDTRFNYGPRDIHEIEIDNFVSEARKAMLMWQESKAAKDIGPIIENRLNRS